jgi:hypothetical protein
MSVYLQWFVTTAFVIQASDVADQTSGIITKLESLSAVDIETARLEIKISWIFCHVEVQDDPNVLLGISQNLIASCDLEPLMKGRWKGGTEARKMNERVLGIHFQLRFFFFFNNTVIVFWSKVIFAREGLTQMEARIQRSVYHTWLAGFYEMFSDNKWAVLTKKNMAVISDYKLFKCPAYFNYSLW